VDFTHYNDQSVATAVDLVNSHGSSSGTDWLGTPDAVRTFLKAHGFRDRPAIGDADIAEIHAVRARLRRVFEGPPKQSAAVLNELLEDTETRPQITNHDGHWHVHYVPEDAAIARHIAACAAMGLAAVVCAFGYERLGVCAAENCRDVFVDTSRNRSRRYCNDTCASRMNVAAYRARHRSPS
jgi:predicted RNA-binding Zn ribbon-like protein